MQRFTGKVALVTGGSSGIGRATATAFAREGAKVVIAARGIERGRETVAEIERAGGSALFVPTDLTKAPQIEALVARTVETFGRLDYAFNNAARGEGAFGLTADLSEDEFDETMTVNLKAVWLGMKHQIRQMLAQNPKGGAVVNTSSVNGLGGVPQASLYAAAKGGVIALTKSAAREYAGQGIRINILVAGAFRTPMLESVMDRIARETATTRQTVEAQYGGLTASGRIGSPEEAAEAVLWLCSDAASYVIGHSMIVDGGMTCVFR